METLPRWIKVSSVIYMMSKWLLISSYMKYDNGNFNISHREDEI